jgi:hypothetical protein
METDNGNETMESEGQAGDAADDREKYATLEVIAQLGWEAHRVWEEIIGEQPKLPWRDLPVERRQEIESGVQYILDHPQSTVAAQHSYWCAIQASKPTLRALNMRPFEELPWAQQQKARLWRAIVHAMVG